MTTERVEFCDLYATRVAQGVVRIRAAQFGGAPTGGIADELARKAPVDEAELQAVAPPEALSWLQSIDKATSAGTTVFGGDDPVFQNLVSLNDWSLAHCDGKYAPLFSEYRGMIS